LFDQLTYKKKNQVLLVIAVILLFIAYQFAIKKTMAAHTDVVNAEQQMELAANAPMMAAQLEKELMLMDAKIGADSLKEKNAGQELLELVTNYCQQNNAVLREFPETINTPQEKLMVETNWLVVAGDFATLINLVYILEQKSKLGKVTSVQYQLKKDLKSKELVLTATIYIQNVKKKEHEN
jgi:hypothetical protein